MAVISGTRIPYSGQENMLLLQRDSSLLLEKQLRACPHVQGSIASVPHRINDGLYSI
jgi:hypothetical protein